ncbi:hypothetical protein TNIN_306371 [Trichonephila inaurata madagascariensis]|uniref:Uncharacterized protein n=1 Tax=Trichonephila inaurata madagascariensis TaxID=2747483 RepID=A0A8X7BSX2_9ARAC|nr:hypothetical protein TNIN_306371 [Trichonephila inaurata madagascariensis]
MNIWNRGPERKKGPFYRRRVDWGNPNCTIWSQRLGRAWSPDSPPWIKLAQIFEWVLRAKWPDGVFKCLNPPHLPQPHPWTEAVWPRFSKRCLSQHRTFTPPVPLQSIVEPPKHDIGPKKWENDSGKEHSSGPVIHRLDSPSQLTMNSLCELWKEIHLYQLSMGEKMRLIGILNGMVNNKEH